jgi:hypothetical protein|tara:strand:+ start:631 stop:1059 length:429 start_codon:yes stop_codon:yes gene_type:complete
MINKKGFLLASFLTTDDAVRVQAEIDMIVATADLSNKFIFLMKEKDNPTNKIITYNAVLDKTTPPVHRLYTIRVHRKKQTNTLYTINALNAAVALQHDGKTGRDLPLDWEKYSNSLILTKGKQLQVHELEIERIYKLEFDKE